MTSPEHLAQLSSIFERNDWEAGYRELNTAEKLFNAICEMLTCFDQNGKKLAMHFMERYGLFTNYTKPLHYVLDSKVPAGFLDVLPVILFPITLDDQNKVKSGHNVTYELSTCRVFQSNVEIVEDIYSSAVHISPNHRYVAVDDFVGTGTQFDAVIGSLFQRGVEANQIFLICICIQHEAFQKLHDMGVNVYAAHVRPKAISDGYAIGDLDVDTAREIYRTMASHLQLTGEDIFGFAQCEALVSMKKTPDNTLAIFWYDKRQEAKNGRLHSRSSRTQSPS